MTVAVIVAVRFIMLFIVADEIVECESVMRANAVDGGPGLASARLKDFARTGNHLCKSWKFSESPRQ
jgi:hypothetical protein